MSKKTVTLYDYTNMCKVNRTTVEKCCKCPLHEINNEAKLPCDLFITRYPEKANEIILNWYKENSVETRQYRFLKMFPNALISNNNTVAICPQYMEVDYSCKVREGCDKCKKEYWFTEVDEND